MKLGSFTPLWKVIIRMLQHPLNQSMAFLPNVRWLGTCQYFPPQKGTVRCFWPRSKHQENNMYTCTHTNQKLTKSLWKLYPGQDVSTTCGNWSSITFKFDSRTSSFGGNDKWWIFHCHVRLRKGIFCRENVDRDDPWYLGITFPKLPQQRFSRQNLASFRDHSWTPSPHYGHLLRDFIDLRRLVYVYHTEPHLPFALRKLQASAWSIFAAFFIDESYLKHTDITVPVTQPSGTPFSRVFCSPWFRSNVSKGAMEGPRLVEPPTGSPTCKHTCQGNPRIQDQGPSLRPWS